MYDAFPFSDWLIASDLDVTSGKPVSIELLPALSAQYPGCIASSVASIRLEAAGALRAPQGWCFWITEHLPAQERLSRRPVTDIAPITQDDGDNYDYSDHPATEPSYELLWAIFRPGQALVVADTLGVFKPESLRLLREEAEFAADAASHAVEVELQAINQRLMGQAQHHSDWAKLLAKELCCGVDLADHAIQRLKNELPLGLRDGEATSLWGELLAEARQDSLLSEGYRRQVDQAVYEAFKALPLATRLAYWLIHSPGASELAPGEDWDQPRAEPDGWELFELDSALARASRKVWARADDEAFRQE
jgi:hypothetical protein